MMEDSSAKEVYALCRQTNRRHALTPAELVRP
ncbi:MAG: hypothetical protein JWM16_2211 [Verrucomicrobiales bacterium]|nr:hypothetical protein [Verrucomicrobiales bacterium]